MIPRLEIHFSLSEQWRFLFGKPYVPEENEFLLNHARSGILLALKAAGLPEGSGVGVMAYNCHTVMNAVKQAGCKPVFLDVTDRLKLDLDDLWAKKEGLSAIVVSHLFGIVNDVKLIKERFPELIVIEDCAHAYGLADLYGDFAVFSIGQGKLPSIGDGGILLVLKDQYRDQVVSFYSALPGYSFAQSAKLFMKLWVMSWIYSPFIYGWMTLPIKRKRGVPSGTEPIFPQKMSRGVSAVYAVKRGRVQEMIASRKKNASDLLSGLPDGETTHAFMGENAFMLVLSCDDPARMKELFRQRGVEADTHFAHSITWAGSFGYVPGTCPRAEYLINHLLMIPSYSLK